MSRAPARDASSTAGPAAAEATAGARWRTHAVAEGVSIAAIAAEREQVMADHFSPLERDELTGRHPQSVAGRLAVKRALCRLFVEEQPELRLAPRDFVITTSPAGAPQLGPLPAALSAQSSGRTGRLLVSLTHTKVQAVGLAVHERALDTGADATPARRSAP